MAYDLTNTAVNERIQNLLKRAIDYSRRGYPEDATFEAAQAIFEARKNGATAEEVVNTLVQYGVNAGGTEAGMRTWIADTATPTYKNLYKEDSDWTKPYKTPTTGTANPPPSTSPSGGSTGGSTPTKQNTWSLSSWTKDGTQKPILTINLANGNTHTIDLTGGKEDVTFQNIARTFSDTLNKFDPTFMNDATAMAFVQQFEDAHTSIGGKTIAQNKPKQPEKISIVGYEVSGIDLIDGLFTAQPTLTLTQSDGKKVDIDLLTNPSISFLQMADNIASYISQIPGIKKENEPFYKKLKDYHTTYGGKGIDKILKENTMKVTQKPATDSSNLPTAPIFTDRQRALKTALDSGNWDSVAEAIRSGKGNEAELKVDLKAIGYDDKTINDFFSTWGPDVRRIVGWDEAGNLVAPPPAPIVPPGSSPENERRWQGLKEAIATGDPATAAAYIKTNGFTLEDIINNASGFGLDAESLSQWFSSPNGQKFMVDAGWSQESSPSIGPGNIYTMDMGTGKLYFSMNEDGSWTSYDPTTGTPNGIISKGNADALLSQYTVAPDYNPPWQASSTPTPTEEQAAPPGIPGQDQWTYGDKEYSYNGGANKWVDNVPLDPRFFNPEGGGPTLFPNATKQDIDQFIQHHAATYGTNPDTWGSIGAYARAAGISKDKLSTYYPEAKAYIDNYYDSYVLPSGMALEGGMLSATPENYRRMLSEQVFNPQIPAGATQAGAYKDYVPDETTEFYDPTKSQYKMGTTPGSNVTGALVESLAGIYGIVNPATGQFEQSEFYKPISNLTGKATDDSVAQNALNTIAGVGAFGSQPTTPYPGTTVSYDPKATTYNAAQAANQSMTASTYKDTDLTKGAIVDTNQPLPANTIATMGDDETAKTVMASRQAAWEAAHPGQPYDPTEQFKEATVYKQFEKYFPQRQPGDPAVIPDWAKPAIDQVEAQLAARGVARNSTIARDSLYSAIVQSAMPMVQQDAAAFQKKWETEFANEEKTILFNAANALNVEMANATFAQSLLKDNAAKLFQLDLTNLGNKQRAAELNLQAAQSIVLSNQAADNAARQFNAQSQNQVDQFMATMAQTINQQNADRRASLASKEAEVTVDLAKTVMQERVKAAEADEKSMMLREQFNSQMAYQIDQANIQWRRQINTLNTAAKNAATQADAMNRFNLSNQALGVLWQEMRDQAYWNWAAEQNSAANGVSYASIAAQSAIAGRTLDLQQRQFESANFWNNQIMEIWNDPNKDSTTRTTDIAHVLNIVGYLGKM
jgi:hypothetical protein